MYWAKKNQIVGSLGPEGLTDFKKHALHGVYISQLVCNDS